MDGGIYPGEWRSGRIDAVYLKPAGLSNRGLITDRFESDGYDRSKTYFSLRSMKQFSILRRIDYKQITVSIMDCRWIRESDFGFGLTAGHEGNGSIMKRSIS